MMPAAPRLGGRQPPGLHQSNLTAGIMESSGRNLGRHPVTAAPLSAATRFWPRSPRKLGGPSAQPRRSTYPRNERIKAHLLPLLSPSPCGGRGTERWSLAAATTTRGVASCAHDPYCLRRNIDFLFLRSVSQALGTFLSFAVCVDWSPVCWRQSTVLYQPAAPSGRRGGHHHLHAHDLILLAHY